MKPRPKALAEFIALGKPKHDDAADDEPMEDEDESEHEDDGDDEHEYREFAEKAFPDEDWTPDRLDALETLIRKCMGEGNEGEG